MFRKIFLGGLAAVALFGSGYLFSINRPLGPALDVAPVEPAAQSQPVSAPAQAQATPAAPVCGQTGVFTLMFLGENLPETPGRGADALRLMRVDFDAGTVATLALPPDLVLDVEGYKSPTLTTLYLAGKENSQGSEKDKMVAGARLLAQSFSDNFTFVPDHYIVLKQSVFAEVVDDIDGLKINLPDAVDGTPEKFGKFEAGQQVLTGQQVVDYVRIFAPANGPAATEQNRIARQNQVLHALIAQLIEPATLLKFPELIKECFEDVVTDLSLAQANSLGCVLSDEDVKFEFFEIPAEMFNQSSGRALTPLDLQQVGEFIREKVGG